MGLYRYSNEREDYPEERGFQYDDRKEGMKKYGYDAQDYHQHGEYKEEKKDFGCEKHDDCDSESARALKKILSLVDELNNQDLRILDDIIHRLLCIRKVY